MKIDAEDPNPLVSIPMQEALIRIQSQGRAALRRRDIPHRSMEAWRFTDINRLKLLISKNQYTVDQENLEDDHSLLVNTVPTVCRIILSDEVNDQKDINLPMGIHTLTPEEVKDHLGQMLKNTGCQHHWPVELNYANANYCLALKVTSRVEDVLEIVYASVGKGIKAGRVLIILEKNTSLSLTQINLGKGLQLSSFVLEAYLGEGSILNHAFLAFGGNGAGLLAHTAVLQEPGSNYKLTYGLRGWGLARFEPRVTQVNGKANSTLKGIQIVEENNQLDTHSYVAFEGPEGKLEQLHKAIADNKGHCIFNGIIRVPCFAQQTNASQLSRNLLISAQARIDTKPELEIVADDVRCNHGATITQMQEEEIFYLQSRGLTIEQSAALLKRGYCQEILSCLPPQTNIWCPLKRMTQVQSPLIDPYKN